MAWIGPKKVEISEKSTKLFEKSAKLLEKSAELSRIEILYRKLYTIQIYI